LLLLVLHQFTPPANWVCFFKLTTKKHEFPTQNWLFFAFFSSNFSFFADLPYEMPAVPPKGQAISWGERGRKEKIVNRQ